MPFFFYKVLTAFLQKHSTPVSIQQQDEDRSREKEEEVSPQVIDQLMSAFAEHMVVTSTPDILSSYLHNDSGKKIITNFTSSLLENLKMTLLLIFFLFIFFSVGYVTTYSFISGRSLIPTTIGRKPSYVMSFDKEKERRALHRVFVSKT